MFYSEFYMVFARVKWYVFSVFFRFGKFTYILNDFLCVFYSCCGVFFCVCYYVVFCCSLLNVFEFLT